MALRCRLWTLVKGSPEALTDLRHTALQLVSLEEQNEDRLALILPLKKGTGLGLIHYQGRYKLYSGGRGEHCLTTNSIVHIVDS